MLGSENALVFKELVRRVFIDFESAFDYDLLGTSGPLAKYVRLIHGKRALSTELGKLQSADKGQEVHC